MSRGALGVALALVLAGCAGGGMVGSAFEPGVYVVRQGDTIYSIAWRYRIDPRDLVRWNDLEQPDRLRVGQRLRLVPPGDGDRGAPAPRARAAAEQQETRAQAPASPEAAADAGATAADAEGDPGAWRWPTSGRVIGTFADGRVAGRGVDIAGSVGQAVQATAAGEVVYSGKGLQAYGQLVIIRHEGEYLSAYAHNSELLVREGQRVTAGQQIARMGESADGEAMLHFEIRRQGRPVDPLDYLPPRD